MKELKGTKTEQNLMEAFAGESQARNKYNFIVDTLSLMIYNLINKDAKGANR